MLTALLCFALAQPPVAPPVKALCDCKGKLPCTCGESCRCVAVSHAECYARVMKGEDVYIAVGVPAEGKFLKSDYPAKVPGLYRCYLLDGKPVVQKYEAVSSVVTGNCPGGVCPNPNNR